MTFDATPSLAAGGLDTLLVARAACTRFVSIHAIVLCRPIRPLRSHSTRCAKLLPSHFTIQNKTNSAPGAQLDVRGHTVKVPWVDAYLHLLEAEHHSALCEGGAKAKEKLKPLAPVLSLCNRLKSVEVSVRPGGQYTLIPCAHSAGVEGHFCISVASRHGVEMVELESGVCVCVCVCVCVYVCVRACVDTHTQISTVSKMRSDLPRICSYQADEFSWRTGCGVRPTATDRLAMAQHPNRAASCYICRKGFEQHQSFYELPEGRVHSAAECKDAYYEQTSEKCLSCRKALLPGSSLYDTEEGKLHAGECYEKFCRARAPKCCECKSPLLGSFYRVKAPNDDVEKRVCAEGDCHSTWQERTADKCIVCGGAVLGRFYEQEAGKVHGEGECWQRFCKSQGRPS